MICHYGEKLLCFKLPRRFSRETCVFISLAYGILNLISDFTVLQLSIWWSNANRKSNADGVLALLNVFLSCFWVKRGRISESKNKRSMTHRTKTLKARPF